MKLVIPLAIVRHALLAAGIVLLSCCAFVWTDSAIFQHNESVAWDQRAALPITATPLPAASANPTLGRIEVKRLGISAIIVEGATSDTLRHAVGHLPGTPLPGRPGNVALSAHRDTFFFPLRNIRANDEIRLTTANGKFRYRVVSTTIVQPGDTGVLESGAEEILTLITCYPFTFIGPAPERFIVRAERLI